MFTCPHILTETLHGLPILEVFLIVFETVHDYIGAKALVCDVLRKLNTRDAISFPAGSLPTPRPPGPILTLLQTNLR